MASGQSGRRTASSVRLLLPDLPPEELPEPPAGGVASDSFGFFAAWLDMPLTSSRRLSEGICRWDPEGGALEGAQEDKAASLPRSSPEDGNSRFGDGPPPAWLCVSGGMGSCTSCGSAY